MSGWLRAAVCAALIGSCAAAGTAAASDRHEGYYYPKPATVETYEARAELLPEADREARIGFITGITNHLANQPYPPQAAIFAKGTEAEKLIIVALEDGRMDTLYRIRAILANMTAAARLLPAFQEMGVQSRYTFLDLCKMLGFEKLTVTNGRELAHQILIE